MVLLKEDVSILLVCPLALAGGFCVSKLMSNVWHSRGRTDAKTLGEYSLSPFRTIREHFMVYVFKYFSKA
jgi:hypothetical protein